MMRMLAYDSREELLAQNLARDIIKMPGDEQNCWSMSTDAPAEPVEIEWKRKTIRS